MSLRQKVFVICALTALAWLPVVLAIKVIL